MPSLFDQTYDALEQKLFKQGLLGGMVVSEINNVFPQIFLDRKDKEGNKKKYEVELLVDDKLFTYISNLLSSLERKHQIKDSLPFRRIFSGGEPDRFLFGQRTAFAFSVDVSKSSSFDFLNQLNSLFDYFDAFKSELSTKEKNALQLNQYIFLMNKELASAKLLDSRVYEALKEKFVTSVKTLSADLASIDEFPALMTTLKSGKNDYVSAVNANQPEMRPISLARARGLAGVISTALKDPYSDERAIMIQLDWIDQEAALNKKAPLAVKEIYRDCMRLQSYRPGPSMQ